MDLIPQLHSQRVPWEVRFLWALWRQLTELSGTPVIMTDEKLKALSQEGFEWMVENISR